MTANRNTSYLPAPVRIQNLDDRVNYRMREAIAGAQQYVDPSARGYAWSRTRLFCEIAPGANFCYHKLLRDGTRVEFRKTLGDVSEQERKIIPYIEGVKTDLGANSRTFEYGPSLVILRPRSIIALYDIGLTHGWMFIDNQASAHDRLEELNALRMDFTGQIEIERPR